MNLQEMVFRALLDYEAQGAIYIEKEKVTLGCMANGSEMETVRKFLTTVELQKKFKDHTLNDINKAVQSLVEKDFIKARIITTTTGINFYELLNSECDLEEFLEG
ncbi:hypothetical protein [Fusobacterium sp.]|uniref:hypothetical protein n=1 Tax=Fusobacterium sp. TaxID=68766 RepID=UPI0029026F27|nr:hypothetical protein [Fusobacterium sp.]MDU1909884.1 hypothetical protein [Fusobacterium sp.]